MADFGVNWQISTAGLRALALSRHIFIGRELNHFQGRTLIHGAVSPVFVEVPLETKLGDIGWSPHWSDGCLLAEQGTSKHSQAQYNYTNTNTQRQIYKYTNTQIHRYKCTNMFDMLGVILTPQWSLCTQTVPSSTISIWCPSLQALFTRTKTIRGTRVMMPRSVDSNLPKCDFFLRQKILVRGIQRGHSRPQDPSWSPNSTDLYLWDKYKRHSRVIPCAILIVILKQCHRDLFVKSF